MATATAKRKAPSVKMQPLGDRVVVERDSMEERTAGGILLPDTAKEKPARGTVISVGNGRLLDDGRRSQLQVKTGDKVLFTSYGGETIKLDDMEYLLISEDHILAVIDE